MKILKVLLVLLTFLVLVAFAFAQATTAPATSPVDNTALLVAVLGALLAISEALSFIPAIKANGIFQLVVNIAKKLAGVKEE